MAALENGGSYRRAPKTSAEGGPFASAPGACQADWSARPAPLASPSASLPAWCCEASQTPSMPQTGHSKAAGLPRVWIPRASGKQNSGLRSPKAPKGTVRTS
eukprot:scaffold301_cov243-Pinguiococcus_pyrenoidosus.AAC.145